MKTILYLMIIFIFAGCSTDKDTYWCGDHSCINKSEKEDYFKKTMIVEIKNLEEKTSRNNSEIEKIIQQARKGEKNIIKEEKNMAKQAKLEAKRKKVEEKNMAKQAKLEKKRKKKEEKYLAKQIERVETRIINKEKTKPKFTVNNNASIENSTTTPTNFNKLVEKITKKNIFRPYPDINDIGD